MNNNVHSCLNNKRGTTSIFLTAILLSMILVIGMLVELSAGKASRSYSDGVLRLAANSILTEYHRTLKRDYGLFAFQGNKDEISHKMKMYCGASFDKDSHRDSMDLLRLRINQIDTDVSGYSLTDLDNLENEISRYMSYRFTELAVNKVFSEREDSIEQINKSNELSNNKSQKIKELKEKLESESENDNQSEECDVTKNEKEGKKKLQNIKTSGENAAQASLNHLGKSNVILKNEMIINSLPSNILDRPFGYQIGGIKSISINEYILDTFSNQKDLGRHGKGFFQNEVEYVLCGNINDQTNYKKVKTEILSMRTALNMTHIYTDKIKLEETLSLASSLTPGPWIPVTQFIIITAWAAAEGGNDIKLLEEGKKVPFIKNSKQWALDLNGFVTGKVTGESEERSSEGLNYKGYLRILLNLRDKNEKLIRIMDLIQINIRGESNKNFLLSDYCIGFEYHAKVEKKAGFLGFFENNFRTTELSGKYKY